MNHRETPHHRIGAAWAVRCLSLLLLPALVQRNLSAPPPTLPSRDYASDGPAGEPVPYLPLIGAPSLRFQALPPPPDLVMKPPAAAPPVPAASPTEVAVAQNNSSAVQPASLAARVQDEAPITAVKPKEASPRVKPPPSILPDDTRLQIRPEDFLPFFQIPGGAKSPGEVNVAVPAPPAAPAPGTLPPSTATYTQTPR
jgi:hypothetical protein